MIVLADRIIPADPDDFHVRLGRAVMAELAKLDREHQQNNLTGHGRDLRDWLHRLADRVAEPYVAGRTVGETVELDLPWTTS